MDTMPKYLNSAQRVQKAIQDSLRAEMSYIYNNLLSEKDKILPLTKGEERDLELYISQVTEDISRCPDKVVWTFVLTSFNHHRYELVKEGCHYIFKDITTEKDKRKIIANILNNEPVIDRGLLKIGNKLMSESSISDIEELWSKDETFIWMFSYHKERFKLVFAREKKYFVLENISHKIWNKK